MVEEVVKEREERVVKKRWWRRSRRIRGKERTEQAIIKCARTILEGETRL